MGLVDFWYIHRERILVFLGATLCLGAIALTLAILVGPTPDAAVDRNGHASAAAACEPDGDAIAGLTRGTYQVLGRRSAAKMNPRLSELGPTAGWPSVYWVENAQGGGVYVSILRGETNEVDDTLNDISSAAYGPGTATMPSRVLAYEGYEISTPGLSERTLAFETKCDHVGIYARNGAEARQAAERLLPLLDA